MKGLKEGMLELYKSLIVKKIFIPLNGEGINTLYSNYFSNSIDSLINSLINDKGKS